MSNLLLKLFSLVTIMSVTLIGGLIPYWYARYQPVSKLWLPGQHFARGIFLGAALLHIFPEAIHHYTECYPNQHYPVIALVTVFSLLFLTLIEYVINRFFKESDYYLSHITVILLTVLLSIHSLIEGAALGISVSFAETMVILIAILAHKGSAAFALVLKMQHYRLTPRTVWIVLLWFSLMTPIGILFGSIIQQVTHDDVGQLALSLINALTAGTFLYIACFEKEDLSMLAPPYGNTLGWQMIHFSCGILLMAIVAIWL